MAAESIELVSPFGSTVVVPGHRGDALKAQGYVTPAEAAKAAKAGTKSSAKAPASKAETDADLIG